MPLSLISRLSIAHCVLWDLDLQGVTLDSRGGVRRPYGPYTYGTVWEPAFMHGIREARGDLLAVDYVYYTLRTSYGTILARSYESA